MGRIFGITAIVCAVVFAFWFVVIHGPGSTTISGGSHAGQ
jgi:predicted secreted protein